MLQGILKDVRGNRDLERMPNRRRRLYFWWYSCIGAAFVLLAVRSSIRGEGEIAILLRVLIAVGFFVLARSFRRPPEPKG